MEFLTPAILTWLPLIGKTSENWSNYDNAMLQRVPFMVVMPGYEKDKSSIPTVDKSISYRLSNTSLVLSPIPSFKLVKTFCLQIIKKSLPFELPIPSSHQNILAMTDEPTILRAVLKSAILMNKLRLN